MESLEGTEMILDEKIVDVVADYTDLHRPGSAAERTVR